MQLTVEGGSWSPNPAYVSQVVTGNATAEKTATDTIKDTSGNTLGSVSGTGYIAGNASDLGTEGAQVVRAGGARPMAQGGNSGLPVDLPQVAIDPAGAETDFYLRNGRSVTGTLKLVKPSSMTSPLSVTLTATYTGKGTITIKPATILLRSYKTC